MLIFLPIGLILFGLIMVTFHQSLAEIPTYMTGFFKPHVEKKIIQFRKSMLIVIGIMFFVGGSAALYQMCEKIFGERITIIGFVFYTTVVIYVGYLIKRRMIKQGSKIVNRY